MFAPGAGEQLHDLNPSTFPPTQLFWTIAIPPDGVQVHLGRGTAVLQATAVPILDYTTIENALFGGGPPPVPGTVSFTVVWHGKEARRIIRNTDPVYGGFAGEFLHTRAQMAWSATVGEVTFQSAPLRTSESTFAEIGHERNGSFFPGR